MTLAHYGVDNLDTVYVTTGFNLGGAREKVKKGSMKPKKSGKKKTHSSAEEPGDEMEVEDALTAAAEAAPAAVSPEPITPRTERSLATLDTSFTKEIEKFIAPTPVVVQNYVDMVNMLNRYIELVRSRKQVALKTMIVEARRGCATWRT